MQVIYKVDILFVWIYSSIILIIGLAGAITTKSLIFLMGVLFIEFVYLFLSLRRYIRRSQAVKRSFPKRWQNFLSTHSPFYKNIAGEDKVRFERDIKIFLSDFSIEGRQRHPVEEELKLMVASSIATLLNGRPLWEPPIRDGILIYPGYSFDKDYQSGRGNYAGLASYKGPMIITEEALKNSFKNANDGFNVIYHEMAHYFDLEDGQAEGIPAARMGLKNIAHWKSLISKEWENAFHLRSFLGEYAGTNEAELFAVATESFFEQPGQLKSKNPELYQALKDFFNLDTAEIINQ